MSLQVKPGICTPLHEVDAHMEVKVCKTCLIEKPVEDFYLCSTKTGRRRGQCKVCRRAKHAEYSRTKWYPANRDKQKASSSKWKQANPIAVLSLRYKLPAEQMQQLVDAKPDACQICSKAGSSLVFDHCHMTGAFRGWLCHHCNTALGLLGDSIEVIRPKLHAIETYLIAGVSASEERSLIS